MIVRRFIHSMAKKRDTFAFCYIAFFLLQVEDFNAFPSKRNVFFLKKKIFTEGRNAFKQNAKRRLFFYEAFLPFFPRKLFYKHCRSIKHILVSTFVLSADGKTLLLFARCSVQHCQKRHSEVTAFKKRNRTFTFKAKVTKKNTVTRKKHGL
jgi:hypothetical protein